MQNVTLNSDKINKIENILEKILEELNNITEENFDQNFNSAKTQLNALKREKEQNWGKFHNFQPSKKIIQLAKLISVKYDNVIKDWANKLKLVQKEIELSQNQKKISMYNR